MAELELVRCEMPQPALPEEMVNLTQALVDVPKLRVWFYSLERLSTAARNAAFTQMAKQMRDDGEDINLTLAVGSLAHPKMYKAVLAAVRERVEETGHPT